MANGEIKFLTRQEPVAVLPGTGGADLLDPLAEKARQRTDDAISTLAEIIDGKRPFLGGEEKGHKWLAGQISRMSGAGYLPEEPLAYFRIKSKDRALGFNPAPHYLIEERRTIDTFLRDSGIENIRIAGSKIALRSQHQLERVQDASRMTLVIPGGFYSLREMLDLIQKKLHGEMINHPIVIENLPMAGQGFYDEILRSIKVMDKNQRVGVDPLDRRAYVDFQALAHHYGIYITEDRERTLDLIKAFDRKLPKIIERIPETPVVPDGSVLFVATGTMKKYEELEKLYKAQGHNVKIRSIFELVDTYVSPKEVGGTYEGNVAEKVHAAINAWHQMGEDERVARLKHLGIKKEQAWILAEDSGFHFKEPKIAEEDEFADIRHKINLEAPFPGVETGPSTIGSNGITNFFDKIRQIFSRRQNPEPGIVKKCVLALAPLKQPEFGKVQMHMVVSEVHGTFTYEPFPNHGSVEIDNFLIPESMPGLPRGQTEAQLGERFYLHHSPRALAFKALAYEMDISTSPYKKTTGDYEANFAVGTVLDSGSYSTKQSASKLAREAHADGFGVIELDSHIREAADPQTNIFAKSDGIVYAFDPEKAKDDFWRNLYLLTSAIVAEQTHDKYKFRKPFYFVNTNRAFNDLLSIVDDFHKLGTVSENPDSLIRVVDTIEAAVDGLKKDRERYRRFHLPAYATGPKGEPEGKDSTKEFNVAIFASATNENSRFREVTAKLTTMLIEENFGKVSGAGLFSMMGEITTISHSKRKSHDAQHVGANVPHIMQGEGDARQYMRQFLQTRNIYERMEYMIDKSDAFVIMPGGTGTVQEFALLAYLKKMADDPTNEYARKKMEGKEIVIVNTPIEHSGVRRGFYDELIKTMDKLAPEDRKKLGIHVVETVDDAVDKLKELRGKKFPGRVFPAQPKAAVHHSMQ